MRFEYSKNKFILLNRCRNIYITKYEGYKSKTDRYISASGNNIIFYFFSVSKVYKYFREV